MLNARIIPSAVVPVSEEAVVPRTIAWERLPALSRRVLQGPWGCIVCQGARGMGACYEDCQYFISTGVTLRLRYPGPLFMLRTFTRNSFPWVLNAYTAPATFEEQGALVRLPSGTVSVVLPPGDFRTSDFYYEATFLSRFRDAYAGVARLMDDTAPPVASGLSTPFVLDHVQRALLIELGHMDGALPVSHLVTIKSAEYLVRALSQLHPGGSAPGETLRLRELAEQIAAMLRARLAERIRINDLAREVGSNRVYIQQAFKARYGMTIFKYHAQLRMERAGYLLLKGEGYETIASSLGYYDGAAFSRAFKKAFGVRPRQYHHQQHKPPVAVTGKEDTPES